MSQAVQADITEMEKKLSCYINRGCIPGAVKTPEEPTINVKPEISLIKALEQRRAFFGSFMAVDCSTRTLKRANNWGIYLMRPSFAVVKKRVVNWGFKERICTVVGDAHSRSNYLTDIRIELESEMALELLQKADCGINLDPPYARSNYLLLDGGGYFGGERKFRVSLYEQAEKVGLPLLAISKNSPSLHDDKGRDFVASVFNLAPSGTWFYYPVRKADKDKSLYGDISIVKLCRESIHVFRCDIMDYLSDKDICKLLSPLLCISEDPRCLGYPISLYLAHDFSAPSDSMLMFYHDLIEEKLANSGLLDSLQREESSCSFADELHGLTHAFRRERWNEQY